MKKVILTVMLFINFWCFAQTESPEAIVQKQVEAYNNIDIDAFLSFYSDDVKIYAFPNKLESEGKTQMRKDYTSLFKNAKTLNCKIVKRIVTKNIVIDEELVKYNDSEFGGVVIYEVENNKIVKVTFVN